jgi:hypothetical protein
MALTANGQTIKEDTISIEWNQASTSWALTVFSSFEAPDAERPFATAYYPAAESESEAALVKIVRSSPLRLSPLRLRKLEVVTINIKVLWADGTRPERSPFTSRIFFIHVMQGPCRRSTTAQENSLFQKVLNMMPWLRSNAKQVRLLNHVSRGPANVSTLQTVYFQRRFAPLARTLPASADSD